MINALGDLRPTVFESLPNIMGVNLRVAKRFPEFFANVRTFINTYDMMHPSLAREYVAMSKVRSLVWIHSWGQSEVGPISAGIFPRFVLESRKRAVQNMNNMGWPWPGKVRVKIVDPDDTSVILPRGRQGIAMVKSDSICIGYLGDEGRYSKKWVDGWWNTGDIAYRDRLNRVVFVDRNVDLISDRSLTQLESALLSKIPTAEEVVLLKAGGRTIVPVIVTSDVEMSGRYFHSVSKISEQLAPPVYLRWEELPLTSTWKVKRSELRDKLAIVTDEVDDRYA
jgi:acyl-coenzyme A synthetase/AMP-(fatty) acid ligase